MVLWYECGGYDRITQNSLSMTVKAKNFRDMVNWLAIIKAISYRNLNFVRHTWKLKLTFLKFPSFMPERSLKYIRMTFLLILSCSRVFFWGGDGCGFLVVWFRVFFPMASSCLSQLSLKLVFCICCSFESGWAN